VRFGAIEKRALLRSFVCRNESRSNLSAAIAAPANRSRAAKAITATV
jgi:hypothetical protein